MAVPGGGPGRFGRSHGACLRGDDVARRGDQRCVSKVGARRKEVVFEKVLNLHAAARPVGPQQEEVPQAAKEGEPTRRPTRTAERRDAAGKDGEKRSRSPIPPEGAAEGTKEEPMEDVPTKKDRRPSVLDKYELIECGGGGACSFLSATALAWRPGEEVIDGMECATRASTLRVELQRYAKKHDEEYSTYWQVDSKWTETTEGGIPVSTWNEWMTALLRPKRWICGLSFRILSDRLRKPIGVVEKGTNGELVSYLFGDTHRGERALLYLEGGHYRFIKPRAGAGDPRMTLLAEAKIPVSRREEAGVARDRVVWWRSTKAKLGMSAKGQGGPADRRSRRRALGPGSSTARRRRSSRALLRTARATERTRGTKQNRGSHP